MSFDPSNAQVEGVADRPEGVCLTPVDFHGLPFRVICYSLLCNPAPLLCDLFRRNIGLTKIDTSASLPADSSEMPVAGPQYHAREVALRGRQERNTRRNLLWPQFSALLLILVSIFYIPAALDFERYRLTAWCSVGARLAGVIFFVGFQPAEYHMLGYFDLAFFLPEAILLTLAFRDINAHDRTDSAGRARAVQPL